MSIEKGRKPNTWLITFWLPERDENGKRRRAPKKTVHGLKSDAKRELARYQTEYRKEIEGVPSTTTVAQYAERFHSQHVMNSPLAYDRERLEIAHICRLFPGVLITDLNPKGIRDAYEKERRRRDLPVRAGDPCPLSEDGLHKVHVKLRQIMGQAHLDDLIPNNPCEKVKFPKPPQRNARNSLTPEDARKFHEQLVRNFELDRDAKLVALLIILGTGCRRGEALGLSWGDVDFTRRTIHLINQYAKDHALRNPKMDSPGRVVGMSDALSRCLKEWKGYQLAQLDQVNRRRARRGEPALSQSDDFPVVTGRYGGRIDPDNMDRFFRNYCVDNGWGRFTENVSIKEYGGRTIVRGKGYEGLRMHELRHTVASVLILEGLSAKQVQSQLGHESCQTTMDLYVHAFESRSREAAEVLGRVLS
ncbi:site-specific integrase [Collinsella tanakaei]|uniref:Site-specific integrase n=1 Tax=Collinsella tanakaei TaxID=626935 RepID=A0A3E4QR58_9ACTN|nr:tyrosine-type recombinase/integrase [Collinsella tanakaei]RGL09561.1 site-specific integrase [Collinsella tanakaei]